MSNPARKGGGVLKEATMIVLYRRRRYRVLMECKSVNNGAKEYLLSGGGAVLVVLASRCKQVRG